MNALRIRLLPVVTALLVTLVGCEAVNEAPEVGSAQKEAQLESLSTYVPTMPLQASYLTSTWGAPTWHRLDEDGSLSSWATDVPYSVQAFEVSGAGSYHIHSEQEFDGFLLLYGGSFDPADPVSGFIAGNDDYGTTSESLVIADLVPGTTYYVVTTGWDSYNYGFATNSLYGPYAATLGSVTATFEYVTYSGTTQDAPTWQRLEADGSLSSSATDVPYSVQAFEVSSAGSYHVRSEQEFDGFLLLYGGSFDPADPVSGFIAGNDDGFSMRDSRVTADLASGTRYYVVTTGYQYTEYGSFTNRIIGPHAITLLGDEDPVEATSDLVDDVEQLVEDGALKPGQANGLIRVLENALRSLDEDRPEDACNQLADFIVEVEAKVPPLTEAQASELIASAAAIRDMLGCE